MKFKLVNLQELKERFPKQTERYNSWEYMLKEFEKQFEEQYEKHNSFLTVLTADYKEEGIILVDLVSVCMESRECIYEFTTTAS